MTPTPFPHLLDPARFQGDVDGRPTALYLLRNARGMVVAITNLGAKVLQIVVPDRHGVLDDVALGYDQLSDVISGSPSMGAFVGRYAGRIGGARFTLELDHVGTWRGNRILWTGPSCLPPALVARVPKGTPKPAACSWNRPLCPGRSCANRTRTSRPSGIGRRNSPAGLWRCPLPC